MSELTNFLLTLLSSSGMLLHSTIPQSSAIKIRSTVLIVLPLSALVTLVLVHYSPLLRDRCHRVNHVAIRLAIQLVLLTLELICISGGKKNRFIMY